jgi:hypothetical protein
MTTGVNAEIMTRVNGSLEEMKKLKRLLRYAVIQLAGITVN